MIAFRFGMVQIRVVDAAEPKDDAEQQCMLAPIRADLKGAEIYEMLRPLPDRLNGSGRYPAEDVGG
jgi:hypothetical protein